VVEEEEQPHIEEEVEEELEGVSPNVVEEVEGEETEKTEVVPLTMVED